MRREQALAFRRGAQAGLQDAPDTLVVEIPTVYDLWETGIAYGGTGELGIVRRTLDGREQLYRCQSPHVSQVGWEPENTPALWVAISAGESGTREDPIPAVRGMEYVYGCYYLDPEDQKIYLCTRTGEAEGGKVVLQYLPHDLIGHYFEIA